MLNLEEKRPKILKYFLITAGLLIVAQFVAVLPLLVFKSGVMSGIILTLLQMNLIVIPLYFIAKKHSQLSIEKTFRIFAPSKGKYYLMAILGTIGIIILQNAIISLEFLIIPQVYEEKFIEMMNSSMEIYRKLFYSGANWKIIIVIFSGGIFPAIYEEFLFRGYLQKNLEISRNPIFAILATSLLFTAFHPYVIAFIPLFVTAVYFGYLAYFTNSIWLAMTAHITNNVFSIIVLNFQGNNDFSEVYDYSIQKTILLFIISGVIVLYVYKFFRKEKEKRSSSFSNLK